MSLAQEPQDWRWRIGDAHIIIVSSFIYHPETALGSQWPWTIIEPKDYRSYYSKIQSNSPSERLYRAATVLGRHHGRRQRGWLGRLQAYRPCAAAMTKSSPPRPGPDAKVSTVYAGCDKTVIFSTSVLFNLEWLLRWASRP